MNRDTRGICKCLGRALCVYGRELVRERCLQHAESWMAGGFRDERLVVILAASLEAVKGVRE
jgi:hypothetical protein